MSDPTTTTRPGAAELSRRAGTARRPEPLPPGQRRLDWFPRFGTNAGRPAPTIPADPVVAIGGEVTEPFTVPVADLATLPRRRLEACVEERRQPGAHRGPRLRLGERGCDDDCDRVGLDGVVDGAE